MQVSQFNSKGDLSIRIKDSNERIIPITYLSSGEKQLLILLTETLLQRKQPYVFIADEPELSLHIAWQRKLIQGIRKINPNAQIIFATHAPEIAANASSKIINMAQVTTIYE